MDVDNALVNLTNASNEIDDLMDYITDCAYIDEKPTSSETDGFFERINDYLDKAIDYLKEED